MAFAQVSWAIALEFEFEFLSISIFFASQFHVIGQFDTFLYVFITPSTV